MGYGTLDIAKCALFAQQIGMQVTSHNIANVNTPGYSRQRVIFSPYDPIPFPFGQVGRGVRVEGITRFYDRFLAFQLDEQRSSKGYWEARSEALGHLESLFNELEGEGLSRTMDEFWQAWHQLANNPQGYAERTSLIEVARELAENLNYKVNRLIEMRNDMDSQIVLLADEVNEITAEIAQLNARIAEAEVGSSEANDLRDQRDRLIEELSEKVCCSVFEDQQGRVSVYIEGSPLVEGANAHWRMEVRDEGGVLKMELVNERGVRQDVTEKLTGGRMGGLISMRNEVIPQVREDLDLLARELIYRVNRLHSQGEGLQRLIEATGAIRVEDPTALLASSGLPFQVQSGSFWIRVFDANGTLVDEEEVAVDPAADSLQDVVDRINASFPGGEVQASVLNGRVHLEAATGYTFSFASEGGTRPDTSGFLAAMELNAFFTGYDALTIAVGSEVISNPELVAAATHSNTPGDNSNALAIANLEGEPVLDGATFGDFYTSLVGQVGVEAEEASSRCEFEDAMLQSLQNRRAQVSGVSLDEEMVNMLKFQRAYEAAVKLIGTIDEMMATLINLK